MIGKDWEQLDRWVIEGKKQDLSWIEKNRIGKVIKKG